VRWRTLARMRVARYEIFALEYLKDFNATAAAKRAGYPPKTAHERGSRLLSQNKRVAEIVEKAMAERKARLTADVDKLVIELMKIASINLDDIVVVDKDGKKRIDLDKLTRDQWAAVESFKQEGLLTQVKFYSKTQAIEMLGRHLGMYKDNPINVNVSLAELVERSITHHKPKVASVSSLVTDSINKTKVA
jgi:phage terminase small subunit